MLEAAPADRDALAALERFLAPGTDGGLRLAAAQALEPIYERSGRFAELAAVVRVYVEAQTDARAPARAADAAGALEETRLGDSEAARATTALAIRDALVGAGAGLVCSTRTSAWPGSARVAEVAALYREISPDVLDEAIKLRLDRTIAEVALAEGDAVTAADYHRRVLDRVPEDQDALEALEGIYRKSGDAEALYEILVRRAELAGADTKAERELRLQIGALAESPLERLDEAIAAYERVLEINGNDREAAQALDRLYIEAERWGDLTRLLEDLLKRGALPERDLVGIRYRMAQIEHDRQNDRETALEHLRVVLSGDPDHPGAITMLEGMLDDIAVQGQAAELLEPVYAARADWPSLIKIGEIRLVQTEEPAARLAWTKRIARLFEEQLEDFDSALRWYGKVFQESPDRAPQPGAAASVWRTSSIAGKTWGACSRTTWKARWARTRRCSTSCAAPRRSSITVWGAARRRRSTTGGCSTRGRTIATPRSVRGGAGALGRLAGAARALRRGGRTRRRPGGEAGAPAPEREARRGEAGQPRARDRDAARGDGRRPRRSGDRRGAGAAAGRGGAVARAGRPPGSDARSPHRRARGRRGAAAPRPDPARAPG